jgi:hypothetical protein
MTVTVRVLLQVADGQPLTIAEADVSGDDPDDVPRLLRDTADAYAREVAAMDAEEPPP